MTASQVDILVGRSRLPVSADNPMPITAAAGSKVNTNAGAAALTSSVLSFSASGDNIAITRAVGTIKVYRLILVVGAASNLTFKNGAGTSLSGAIPLVANEAIVLTFDGEPWYTTTGTNNFIINSSSAVQVSGTIYYLDS